MTDTSFDLARLSKSKEVVDIAPNTLRKFNRRGLKFYRSGRAIFFSKAELEAFIRAQSEPIRSRPQPAAA